MKWKSDLPTVTQLGNGRAGIWTHAGLGLSTKLLSCRLVKWPEPKGSFTPLVPPSFPTIHPDLGLWNTLSITPTMCHGENFSSSQPNMYWVKGSESHSVVSDSLQPHGLYSPWNSPGQNTGVGSLSLLQGIFPSQGSNPGLLHCRRILYQLSHKRSPLRPILYFSCLCTEVLHQKAVSSRNTFIQSVL